MNYNVVVTTHAQRQIDRLPPVIRSRILRAAFALAENPRPHGCLKLSGVDRWRIRVGSYRVVYEIRDAILTVTVVEVFLRGRGYRQR